jgi:hypothetical protein
MKLATSVAAAGVLVGIHLALPVLADNPPATTYQPGFWQPAARVNPQADLKITIVNQTPMSVGYDFTNDDNETQQLLAAGQSITYENGKNPLPLYLLVSGSTSTSRLNYDVSAKDNVVTVTVHDKAAGEPPNSAVAIDTTGAIYMY